MNKNNSDLIDKKESIWFNKFSIKDINIFCEQTIISHLDIIITDFGPNWIKGVMGVSHKTVQPLQYLHGGASVVLAETLGSLGSNLTLDQSKQSAFGQSITANHIRPVPINNEVEAIATIIYKGRQTHIWETLVTHKNKLVCKSTLTTFITNVKKVNNTNPLN